MKILRRLPILAIAALPLLLAAACTGEGPSPTPQSTPTEVPEEVVRLWMPEVMGLGILFRDFVAPPLLEQARIELQIQEEDIPFEGLEALLRDSLTAGDIDADLVAVPAAMGRRLLDDGLLDQPVVFLFSTEEALGFDLAAVLMAAPASQTGARSRQTDPLAGQQPLVWSGDCPQSLTVQAPSPRRYAGLASPLLAPLLNGGPSEAEEFAEDIVENAAKEFAKKGLGNLEKVIITEGTEIVLEEYVSQEALDELVKKYGPKTATRIVGRAFVIVGVANDLGAIIEFSIEGVRLADAQHSRDLTLLETVHSAQDAMLDIQGKIIDVKNELISCELDGAAGEERVLELWERGNLFGARARDTISDIARAGDGDTAQSLRELTDNIEDRNSRLATEVLERARAKSARQTSTPTPTPTPPAPPPTPTPPPMAPPTAAPTAPPAAPPTPVYSCDLSFFFLHYSGAGLMDVTVDFTCNREASKDIKLFRNGAEIGSWQWVQEQSGSVKVEGVEDVDGDEYQVVVTCEGTEIKKTVTNTQP